MASGWRRSRVRYAIALVVGTGGVAASVALFQPLWAFAAIAKLFPGILWRVETSAPLVALTFDDGPAPDHTPGVLAILERHRARATFFLIGDRAAAHSEMVASLRAAGHDIGNHYDTIRSTRGASDAEFLANLHRAEAVLGRPEPKLFRPPDGVVRPGQLRLLQAEGYKCVLGSAYPYDPAHPPAAYIQWLVAKNLSPGVIVILHDGIADPSRSLAALDGILAAGRRKGLRFVPLRDC